MTIASGALPTLEHQPGPRPLLRSARGMTKGGRLLLYTGAAPVDGHDTFLRSARRVVARPGARYSNEELDPDIFAEELERPRYADVERMAAVLLRGQVGGAERSSE